MNADPRNLNHALPIIARFAGVTDIETNVAAKTVVVTHADGVSASEMLEMLKKVSLVELERCLRFFSSWFWTVYLLLLQPSGLKQVANQWRWHPKRSVF